MNDLLFDFEGHAGVDSGRLMLVDPASPLNPDEPKKGARRYVVSLTVPRGELVSVRKFARFSVEREEIEFLGYLLSWGDEWAAVDAVADFYGEGVKRRCFISSADTVRATDGELWIADPAYVFAEGAEPEPHYTFGPHWDTSPIEDFACSLSPVHGDGVFPVEYIIVDGKRCGAFVGMAQEFTDTPDEIGVGVERWKLRKWFGLPEGLPVSCLLDVAYKTLKEHDPEAFAHIEPLIEAQDIESFGGLS